MLMFDLLFPEPFEFSFNWLVDLEFTGRFPVMTLNSEGVTRGIKSWTAALFVSAEDPRDDVEDV